MINKEKIDFNEMKYYTPSWNSSTKIMILKVFENNSALVQALKGKPFVRQLEYIFNKAEHANRSRKDWESSERRRKKK